MLTKFLNRKLVRTGRSETCNVCEYFNPVMSSETNRKADIFYLPLNFKSMQTKLPEIKVKKDRRQYVTVVLNGKSIKLKGDRF